MTLGERKIGILLVALGLLFFLLPRPVHAWGERGHQWIGYAAARHLPEELPAFFREAIKDFGYLAIQPDRWKVYGKELRNAEYANHFLDLEELGQNLQSIQLPATRGAYIRELARQKKSPSRTGFLPYQIQEYYQRLKGAFQEYRWAVKDPRGQDSRSPRSFGPRSATEHNCIHSAGILAHYAGDASQPLHATVFYDGRGPEGKPRQTGIHAKFEVAFVQANIKDGDFDALIKPPAPIQDVLADALRTLKESNGRVEELFALEARGKFDGASPEAVEFTRRRLAAGSQFLLNLWYTAWVQSGRDLELYQEKFKPRE